MPHENKQRTAELRRRRAEVSDLYIQGYPQVQIAEQMGVSQSTISNDLKAIQNEWRNSAIRDFDVLREREIKKLDRIEREAWDAWKRSQKPAQSATITTNGQQANQKTQKRLEDQYGDPRYLDQIHKCIAGRRALLGLDAPTKIAPTSPDGEEAYHSHVMAELMRLAEKADSPEVIDADFVAAAAEQQRIEQDHAQDNG